MIRQVIRGLLREQQKEKKPYMLSDVSPDGEVWVGLIGPDPDAWTGETEIGFIKLDRMDGHSLRWCRDNLYTLREKVFGVDDDIPFDMEGAPKVLRVQSVEIMEDKYKGKGWGKAMYEKAFKLASPALIVTGGCTGMGTTTEAFRVWQSLSEKYPSMGDSPDNMVMAV